MELQKGDTILRLLTRCVVYYNVYFSSVVLSCFFIFHKFHTEELGTCNNQERMEQLSTFAGYDKLNFFWRRKFI